MFAAALPIGVGLLAGWAWYAKSKRENAPPSVVAERKKIFETALNSKLEASQLKELAAAFHKVGMKAEGSLLEKRAALREAPESVTAERREIFKRAMKQRDPKVVLETAEAFDELGATGAAANLREYAKGLMAADEHMTEEM